MTVHTTYFAALEHRDIWAPRAPQKDTELDRRRACRPARDAPEGGRRP